MDNVKLRVSHHGLFRQKQRDISSHEILKTVSDGVKDVNDSVVYYDETNKVVVKNDKVVTVIENKRNTRFDLLDKNKSKIESLIHKAEVQKNDSAMCELAEIYLNGDLCERDKDGAHELYLQAGLLGSSHAMCRLSQLYAEGTFGKPNKELSDKWMLKAADKGNTYALAVTGQRLLAKYKKEKHDYDTNSEKEMILHYLNKAVAQGSTRAKWTLAKAYEDGDLGEKDLPKAIQLYSKAARVGSPSSVVSLHRLCNECLFKCELFEEILNALVVRLAKASCGTLFDLGEEQVKGQLGFSKSRGLNMIEACALKNNDAAMVKLAKCYRDGVACKPNLVLCQYWYNELYSLYKTSSEQGNMESLWKLAKYLVKGYTDVIYLDVAEVYFERVVLLLNSAEYAMELGMMYLNGCLGDRDPDLGNSYIKNVLLEKEEAARNNDANECLYLGTFYFNNCQLFGSYEKAKYWLSQALNLGMQEAEPYIAELYLTKTFGGSDIKLGLQIFEKLILNEFITIEESFDIISNYLTFHDPEYVSWLEEKSTIITNDNILILDSFDEAVEYQLKKKCLLVLALAFIEKDLVVEYCKGCNYLYRLYADFKDTSSLITLCEYYFYDKVTDEHSQVVKRWLLNLPDLLEKSQDLNFFTKGASLLGLYLKKGKVFPLNLQEAAMWLCLHRYIESSIAEVTSMDVLETLGEEFASIAPNLFKHEYIANEIVRMAQQFKNSSPIMYNNLSRVLGDIYVSGYVAKKDDDKAIYWYSESSGLNNMRASLSLARMYRKFKGGAKNKNALKFFKLAIQQGSEDAIKEVISLIEINKMPTTHLAFLNNYQHKPSISFAEISIRSFKQLSKYPTSVKEFHEQAMVSLSSDVFEGVYWLRKAIKRNSLESAVELHNLYKSGSLGSKLIPVANVILISILNIGLKWTIRIKCDISKGTEVYKECLKCLAMISSNLKKVLREECEDYLLEIISTSEKMLVDENIDVTGLDIIISNFIVLMNERCIVL